MKIWSKRGICNCGCKYFQPHIGKCFPYDYQEKPHLINLKVLWKSDSVLLGDIYERTSDCPLNFKALVANTSQEAK